MHGTAHRFMEASMSTNAGLEALGAHAARMDAIYRSQRHIYDITRAYYLLGRDGLLDGLAVQARQRVLEMGCGTGRNLLGAVQRYPHARFFGLDISREMLCSAEAALLRAGHGKDVKLALADATFFDPRLMFGVPQFDCVYFSYTLSMIPDWRAALRQSLAVLKPGGSLHIVDFGGCERLPRGFKSVLYAWLGRFHVAPRLELEQELHALLALHGGKLKFERPFRGYAVRAKLTLPN
jgi:S-adenosylmethionine-diacylgycerolhomoserine-N-methlytransferase